jgi:NADH-ubiquinone oxidoreductase chain 4
LFELSLIPILLMILSQGTQPERLSAGAYLLFYTTFLSIPYLIILLSLKDKLFIRVRYLYEILGVGGLIMMLPFIVKMPILGLHF